MKLISFILAFYIIVLSAVPCCSFDNCPDDNPEQKATHEKPDGGCGNCSPFFNCEGCAPATIAWSPLHVEIPATKISPVYTIYQQAPLSAIQYDFWQPPKLG